MSGRVRLRGCVAEATAANLSGELGLAAPGDDYSGTSYGGLDNDEIAVLYRDSAGALRSANRQEFSLVVFC